MRLLFVGDVVGKPGRRILAEALPLLRRTHAVDFVVVNGENAAGGAGLTPAVAHEIFALGVDVVTLGNHAWDKRELAPAIDTFPRLVRPLNFPPGTPGQGSVVAETQAGKSSLVVGHPANMGSLGVTGTAAANDLAAEADLVLAVGTRLQDFTTGSWALFQDPELRLVGLNTQPFDATKHGALPLVADARDGLAALDEALGDWRVPAAWSERARAGRAAWLDTAAAYIAAPTGTDALPSDAQVIGAVQRAAGERDVVVCAAGGLPGELHKHWQAGQPGGYHMEYGFSCMGYEIAGGLGVKMAEPDREVVVMVGDGSYLMLNSEIATSVMLGRKLSIVVLDNRGFGCINRLQQATGGAAFNNLLADTRHERLPEIDFAAHARALGAVAEKVAGLAELPAALARARAAERTHVVVIDTEARTTTDAGGAWWDVAVPEVSQRAQVETARRDYLAARARQRAG